MPPEEFQSSTANLAELEGVEGARAEDRKSDLSRGETRRAAQVALRRPQNLVSLPTAYCLLPASVSSRALQRPPCRRAAGSSVPVPPRASYAGEGIDQVVEVRARSQVPSQNSPSIISARGSCLRSPRVAPSDTCKKVVRTDNPRRLRSPVLRDYPRDVATSPWANLVAAARRRPRKEACLRCRNRCSPNTSSVPAVKKPRLTGPRAQGMLGRRR